MSLPKESQEAFKILLESEIVMKLLLLHCVDFTWNAVDPVMVTIHLGGEWMGCYG
jgi:hypothetical protein